MLGHQLGLNSTALIVDLLDLANFQADLTLHSLSRSIIFKSIFALLDLRQVHLLYLTQAILGGSNLLNLALLSC